MQVITDNKFIEIAKKAGFNVTQKENDHPRVLIDGKGKLYLPFCVEVPIGKEVRVSEEGMASVFSNPHVCIPYGCEENNNLRAHIRELKRCSDAWTKAFFSQ